MPSCNPITRENVGQVGMFHFLYAATLRLLRLNFPCSSSVEAQETLGWGENT